MVFSNNLLMGAGGQASGYDIEQSIRFNDGDSAHLSRTLGTASNRKIWTYSVWIKRSTLGTRQMFFTVAAGGGAQGIIEFDQGDGGTGDMNKIVVNNETSGTTALNWELEIHFVDPAAWYHFVFVYDTTQSTANDRFKCYVNGQLQTEWDRNSTPGQNEEQAFNNALDHRIGEGHTAANYFDGYMAEIHFIDGTAKAASDFGETNSDTGEWVPTTYGGSYGNNGFYLKGQDSSALGDDTSGNGNDFASSGLAAADQVEDSPTDNFATFNGISGGVNQATLSDGNLTATRGSGTGIERSTISVPATGNWYAEFTIDSTGSGSLLWSVGVIKDDDPGLFQTSESRLGNEAEGYAYATNWSSTPVPHKSNNGTRASYGTAGSNGDVIGVQLNNGSLTFYHNNTSKGEAYSGLSGNFLFGWSGQGSATVTANFGQSGFTYTPPTGAVALSTANLDDPAIPDPSAHFQPTVYEGNGTAIGSGGKAVTQVGSSTFQPDLVWIKCFTTGNEHDLYDAVRGTTKAVFSSANSAQATVTEGLTTFGSSGFTVGNRGEVNTNATDHVAWQWKANGSGSSNSDGDTTATVSANATSGFSIIKYEGTGSATTVGHGLGVAPKVMMVKDLDNSRSWNVYHAGMGDATKVMYLDQAVAAATDSTIFGSAPTSSVVNIVSGNGSNGSGINYIMYAFVEVEGYSKFGSYEGNNSTDGPFVSLGFKPRLVMCKRYDGADGWTVLDTSRGSANFGSAAGTGGDNPTAGNLMNVQLNWNTNGANEDNAAGSRKASFTSNGFKVQNTNTAMNASGGDYVYMAFAESPFKTATAR